MTNSDAELLLETFNAKTGNHGQHAVHHALEATRKLVTDTQVIRNHGAGQAYQLVAQSTAMAVQDAVDYLRSASMIASTTIGVASARMVEEGTASEWKDVLKQADRVVHRASKSFDRVGSSAARILRTFPPDVDHSKDQACDCGEPECDSEPDGFGVVEVRED